MTGRDAEAERTAVQTEMTVIESRIDIGKWRREGRDTVGEKRGKTVETTRKSTQQYGDYR